MQGRAKMWYGVAPGAVVLLVVLHIVARHRSHARLEQRIKDLQAKGYPTTYDELIEQRELPPGVPNAADLYIKAFVAYQPPSAAANPFLPLYGNVNWSEEDYSLPEASRIALAEFLNRNAEALELLHQAGQVKDCYYGPDPSWPSLPTTPHKAALNDARRLLVLAAGDAIMRGDAETACQYIMDGFRLGQSLDRGFGAMDAMIQWALYGIVVRLTQDALSHLDFEESRLARLQQLLSDIEQYRSLVVEGEMVYILESARAGKLYAHCGLNPAIAYSGLAPQAVIACLDRLEETIEAEELPLHERLRRLDRIHDEAVRPTLSCALSRLSYPSVDRANRIFLDLCMRLTLARVAVALERYRSAQGRLPDRLEALVPDYLAVVPLDFDGQPIRYERSGAGYVVKSVSIDFHPWAAGRLQSPAFTQTCEFTVKH